MNDRSVVSDGVLNYFQCEQSDFNGDPGCGFEIPYRLRNERGVNDDGQNFLHRLSRLYFRAYGPALSMSDEELDTFHGLRVRLTDHACLHRLLVAMNDVSESS